MIRLLLMAWDRLSIYLPIAMMGLMALGTYWLVRIGAVLILTGLVFFGNLAYQNMGAAGISPFKS